MDWKIDWKILAKSVIYRLYSAIIAFIVLYLLTGKLSLAGIFTSTLELVKLVQYYFFEKLWHQGATAVRWWRNNKRNNSA